MIGFFYPTEIGTFCPTQNGRFCPTQNGRFCPTLTMGLVHFLHTVAICYT